MTGKYPDVAVVCDDPTITKKLTHAFESAKEPIISFEDVSSLFKARPDNSLTGIVLETSGACFSDYCIERIRHSNPNASLIIVSKAPSTNELTRAVGYSAIAYLDIEYLESVVKATHLKNGSTLVDNATLRTALASVMPSVLPITLTPTERKVLDLIGLAMTNADIAIELDISINTVKTHVRQILRKLNVKDRTQAAIVAIQQLN